MERTMIELIKKAVLTGIGVASLTKEKMEEISKEFIKKGKLSEEEGENLVADMLKRAEESRKSLEKQTEKIVDTTLGKMQLVRASDISELKTEIEGLRKEVESLKNNCNKEDAN
jgi:polyhydroxyalkanoate synthesis regulator phasin